MADDRATAQACREVMSKIRKIGDDSAVMPQVMAELMQLLGGPAGYARKLHQDFQIASGYGENGIGRKEGIVLKYHALIAAMQAKQDENTSIDATGLTDDDVRATLTSLAMDLIANDPSLRKRLVHSAVKDDPELRNEIVELSGQVVIEPPPAIPVVVQEEEVLDE